MSLSIVFIVNPIAGRSSVRPLLSGVAARLRRSGHRVRVLESRAPGDAKRLSTTLPPDVDRLVVVGGDGTIREVLTGRASAPLPIAVLPAGTENVFAKNYGYRADGESLTRCLIHGHIRSVDMATANDQYFLVMAGAGFDAEAVARLSRSRRGHISYLSYAMPLWRTYWEYRFPPIRVLADGQPVFEGRGLVLVGNLPRYAMGLRILRDARDDDGLLDVCAFACRSQARLLGHAAMTLARRHVASRGVFYCRAQEVQLESRERVPFQVDGDLAGHLPARLAAVPRAALLCLPA